MDIITVFLFLGCICTPNYIIASPLVPAGDVELGHQTLGQLVPAYETATCLPLWAAARELWRCRRPMETSRSTRIIFEETHPEHLADLDVGSTRVHREPVYRTAQSSYDAGQVCRWGGLWTAARPQCWPETNHVGWWLSTNFIVQLTSIT